jgi:secreted Zn-dependent insulinase-like peptidase
VIKHVFQYIALLKAPGVVTEDLFRDNAALKRLGFDYRNKPDAFSHTSQLAHMLHLYPVKHLLEIKSGVPLKYDEAVIHTALDALTPERLLCMWVSHAHSPDGMQTERWCVSAVLSWQCSCELLVDWVRLDPFQLLRLKLMRWT